MEWTWCLEVTKHTSRAPFKEMRRSMEFTFCLKSREYLRKMAGDYSNPSTEENYAYNWSAEFLPFILLH